MIGEFLQYNESSSMVYSVSEIPAGTWIDGRSVYSRTFHVNNPTIDLNNWIFVQMTDDMNIDMFIDIKGMVKVTINSQGTVLEYWQPLPRVVPDDCSSYSIDFGDINAERIGILFGTAYISVNEIYTTVYYVKGE